MKITRKFTVAGRDPFASTEWVKRSSRITNPDGSVVFEMKDAEMPAGWSQLAVDIMVSKYFRKAGVPQLESPYALPGQSPVVKGKDGKALTGPERSARQVIHRLAGCWRFWGEENRYFDSPEDAQAFYDEIAYMMVHQMCAPNSPQWFNTGLHWAYGINGPAQGHCIVDPATGEVVLAPDSYSHPQPHACFIQGVTDDLVNDGGIMDLWVREARLFKYGSGTGTNFSNLRAEGEKLSGGGKSSGLMSWLKIGDRAAGAIKSGGTTRRAAKMVCLDMDHPDIQDFINWKVREEIKVAALVEGMKHLSEAERATAARLGLKLDYDFNGESYLTVSGQNSNNSVRVPSEFFDAVDAGAKWVAPFRTNPEMKKEFDARALWKDLCFAAWRCADPGVQFDTTINEWHTCPGAGRINASNPCSEYMFLDNTACNLASLNVMTFYDRGTHTFDIERFEHGVDLWTIVLEISVLMAAFPSREIAELSYKYRTLGLGFANLGAMLMQAGIAYDSDQARAVCACLSAIMTGRSYRQSALMAEQLGAFPGYKPERESMLRVIRNHARAARGVSRDAAEWESLRIRPVPIDHGVVAALASGKGTSGGRISNAGDLGRHAIQAWEEAQTLGEQFGYRNAQVTVIAPTGTIGLLMDCDTTGVEPDFALVKFKKLAGGGYFKIANESVRPALETLGYSASQIKAIMEYLLGTLDLDVPMPAGAGKAQAGQTLAQWLRGKGLNEDELGAVHKMLPSVFELKFAFGSWCFSEDTLRRLKVDPAKAKADSSWNLLKALGLKGKEIEALNRLVCGTQTVEGAPHLKAEHLAVFDCASKCGATGTRFIAPEGHIRMMAASQPFITGAISKTINLPNEATVEDIDRCYRMSWELGLKANALYRDGCKLSQPLSTKSEGSGEVDLESEVDEQGESEAKVEVAVQAAGVAAAAAAGDGARASELEKAVVHRPMRRRLPDTRASLTHKFNVAGHEGYLTVGIYEDGMPGELFITMAKEGSTIGGLMDSLGTATSVALQYGVPLESLVKKFTHQRFEPAGMTANRDIPFAKSLVDYIFRWLGIQFIPGYKEANTPNRGGMGGNAHDEHEHDARSGMGTGMGGGSGSPARISPAKGEQGGGGRRTGTPGTVVSATVAKALEARPGKGSVKAEALSMTLSIANESAGDAPPCDVCGTITVRSGTCYKCLNCGASLGCS